MIRWKSRGNDCKGRNYVTRKELHCHLIEDVQQYRSVELFPMHPAPKGVYIFRPSRFKPASGEMLLRLLERFCPASETDAALIQALAMTPFWGGPPGARPLFLITAGEKGSRLREIGKTKLVTLLAELAGGYFTPRIPEGRLASTRSMSDQLCEPRAQQHRVILLDNLDRIASTELAELITSEQIWGSPKYIGAVRRPNFLTWTATAVSPELAADFASRSFVVRLDAPSSCPEWFDETQALIRVHHIAIVGEILHLLQGEKVDLGGATPSRFPRWAAEVLAVHPLARDVLQDREGRVIVFDEDHDERVTFLHGLLDHLRRGSRGDHRGTRIPPKELGDVWRSSLHEPHKATNAVTRRLREWLRGGSLPEGFKRASEKRNGADWVVDLANLAAFLDPADGFTIVEGGRDERCDSGTAKGDSEV